MGLHVQVPTCTQVPQYILIPCYVCQQVGSGVTSRTQDEYVIWQGRNCHTEFGSRFDGGYLAMPPDIASLLLTSIAKWRGRGPHIVGQLNLLRSGNYLILLGRNVLYRITHTQNDCPRQLPLAALALPILEDYTITAQVHTYYLGKHLNRSWKVSVSA